MSGHPSARPGDVRPYGPPTGHNARRATCWMSSPQKGGYVNSGERTRRSSTRTVQAPHVPWSHPTLVRTRPRGSRGAGTSVVRASTSKLLRRTIDGQSHLDLLDGDRGLGPAAASVDDALIDASAIIRKDVTAA